MEPFYELLLEDFLLMKFMIINFNRFRIRIADHVNSHFGTIKAPFYRNRTIHIGIHTHTQTNAIDRNILAAESVGSTVKNLLIVLAMRTINHKSIRFTAAYNSAGISDHLTNFQTDAAENFIPVCIAEPFIDDAEMIDVDNDGIHFHILMVLIKKFSIMIEKLTIVEIGKGISFRDLDREAVLKKFNRAADTC